MTRDRLVMLAAISGAVAIAAGAFAAHGATGKAADWLHTGSMYQLVNAVAVLALARTPRLRVGGWAILGGSAFFAVTLYLMAASAPLWLGAVTPLGGIIMIGGWLGLAWTAR